MYFYYNYCISSNLGLHLDGVIVGQLVGNVGLGLAIYFNVLEVYPKVAKWPAQGAHA